MMDDDAIVKEIYIEAAPADVFPYLTQTDKYLLWMGISAELDPRPGGAFRVNLNGRDEVVGEFVTVEPPRRVVFTWGWSEPGQTPEFDEFTIVLYGALVVDYEGGQMTIRAGQALHATGARRPSAATDGAG